MSKNNEILDSLEKLQAKSLNREYQKTLNAIQKEALRLFDEGKLTRKNLNDFIKKNQIDVSIFKTRLVEAFMYSAMHLSDNRDNNAKQKKEFSPMRALKYAYTADIVANKIHVYSQKITKGSKGKTLRGKDKSLYLKTAFYVDKNANLMKRISKDFEKGMKRINQRITTSLSKDIFNNLDRLNKKIGLTFDDVSSAMHSKYGKGAKFRTERILRTEVHAMNQFTENVLAISNAYKFKTWRNRPNLSKSGVSRDFHVANRVKKVAIDKPFIVKGEKLMYPGDLNSSVWNRVNCNCESEYTNT
jgi:Ca2+-binding EF-hand superfamily protein